MYTVSVDFVYFFAVFFLSFVFSFVSFDFLIPYLFFFTRDPLECPIIYSKDTRGAEEKKQKIKKRTPISGKIQFLVSEVF